uniref:Enamelin n=2 Tax=Haemonchus contortus TaxID=6289 RepID=A0A7I4XX82_HAECO
GMRLFLLLLLPAVITGAKYPMAPAYYPPEEMNTNIPIAIMNPYQSMMPDTPGMDDYQFYYEKDPKPAGPVLPADPKPAGPVPPAGTIPGGSAQQPGPSPTHSGSFNKNEIEVPVTSIENPDPYREAMMEGTAQTKFQGDPDTKVAKPFLTKVMEAPSASPYDTGSPGGDEIAKNNLVVPTTYDDSVPGESPYGGEPSGGNKPLQNNPKAPTGAASAGGSPYDQGPPGGAVPPVPLSRSQQPGNSENEYSGWKPVLPNSSNVPTVNGATPGEGSPYDQGPSDGPAPPVPLSRSQQPGDSEYEYNGWTPVPKRPSTEPYGSDTGNTGSGYPSGNDDDINLKLPKGPSVSTGTVDPRGNGGSSEQDNSNGRSNISPPSHQNGGYTATNTANSGRESKGGGEKVLTPKDGFPRAEHFNLGEPNAPPGRSPDGLDKSNEWTPGSHDRVLDRQHSNLGRTSSGPGGSVTDDLLDPTGNIGEGADTIWDKPWDLDKKSKTTSGTSSDSTFSKEGRPCCPCCSGSAGPASGRNGGETQIAGSAQQKVPITHNTVSIGPFKGKQKQEVASKIRNNAGFEEILDAQIDPVSLRSGSSSGKAGHMKAGSSPIRVGSYPDDDETSFQKPGTTRGKLWSVDSRTPPRGSTIPSKPGSSGFIPSSSSHEFTPSNPLGRSGTFPSDRHSGSYIRPTEVLPGGSTAIFSSPVPSSPFGLPQYPQPAGYGGGGGCPCSVPAPQPCCAPVQPCCIPSPPCCPPPPPIQCCPQPPVCCQPVVCCPPPPVCCPPPPVCCPAPVLPICLRACPICPCRRRLHRALRMKRSPGSTSNCQKCSAAGQPKHVRVKRQANCKNCSESSNPFTSLFSLPSPSSSCSACQRSDTRNVRVKRMGCLPCGGRKKRDLEEEYHRRVKRTGCVPCVGGRKKRSPSGGNSQCKQCSNLGQVLQRFKRSFGCRQCGRKKREAKSSENQSSSCPCSPATNPLSLLLGRKKRQVDKNFDSLFTCDKSCCDYSRCTEIRAKKTTALSQFLQRIR